MKIKSKKTRVRCKLEPKNNELFILFFSCQNSIKEELLKPTYIQFQIGNQSVLRSKKKGNLLINIK